MSVSRPSRHTLVALVAVVGAGLLITSACSASGPPLAADHDAVAPPRPAGHTLTQDPANLLDDGDPSVQATHTIRFRVTNATDTDLTVASTDRVNGRWRTGEAPTVGSRYETPEIHDYNLESTWDNTQATVYYRIGDTKWYAAVKAENPSIASNKTSCWITDQKLYHVYQPSQTGYACQSHAGSGNDMNADFVVQSATAKTQTLTDSTTITRRDAIDALCREGSGPRFVSCQVGSLDNISHALGDETVVSSVLVNCGDAQATESVGKSVALGQTNTIGITASSQAKLSEMWSTTISGSYSKAWSDTRTTSYTATLAVPSGQYGWIGISAQMVNITGDYTLTAGNQTYRINNVTLKQPATDAWVAKNGLRNDVKVIRSYPLPDKDGICENRDRSFWQPQPATLAPGKSFVIGVQDHNQWTISVPDRSHALEAKLQLDNTGNAQRRNQHWTLLPVKGQPTDVFQISSDNTPSMCMDVYEATGPDVIQWYCKDADDEFLANQLWKLVYDPASGGYEIRQPATGQLLARADSTLAVGNKIHALTDPSSDRSRWTLWQ